MAIPVASLGLCWPAAAQDGGPAPTGDTVPTVEAPPTTVAPEVVPPTVVATETPAPAPAEGPAPAVDDGMVADSAMIVPDVVILVGPEADAAATVASVQAALATADGVAWAVGDPTVAPPQVLVGLDPRHVGRGLDAVDAAIAADPASAQLAVTGRALSDRSLQHRADLAAVIAGLLAALAVGAYIFWLRGRDQGLLAGAAVAAGALVGAVAALVIAGPFDGSIATTPIPGVLGGVLMATYVLFRLLDWFSEPVGDDHAEMTRHAWRSLGMELALFFAGLVVITVFLEVLSPARTVVSLLLVSSGAAAVVTMGLLPPALAELRLTSLRPRPDPLDSSDPSDPAADGVEAVASTTGEPSGNDDPLDAGPKPPLWLTPAGSALPGPDGRQVPVWVLLGMGALLAFLALFSFQAASPARLFDARATTDASTIAPLLEGDGDPTAAIAAHFAPGIDQLAKTAWLERVSQLPSVARVETATGRYAAGALVDVTPVPLGTAGLDRGDETPEVALVIPSVTGRSPAAQDLVGAIEATSSTVQAELAGEPVDARSAGGRDASGTWVLLVALALVSGAAVFGLIGDISLAAASAGLRLLGSAAAVGIYQLLTTEPTGAELQLVVLITAIGGSLFELGYLRSLVQHHRHDDTDVVLDDALQHEGWAAMMALAVAGLASVGLLAGNLAVLRRLALLGVVVVLVETMIGLWLLRPPVLGRRAIRHFAGEPVRAALRALVSASASPEEDERWTAIVGNLLHTEFALQSEPAMADLDKVFVPGTPLYRKAVDHHQHLADAGLNILGRAPQLRSARVVGTGPPVTVAVTVDHPPRQLLNREGEVLGVRKPERRSVMLWIREEADGSHRISDTVELGIEPLGAMVDEARVTAPVSAGLAEPTIG